MEWMNRKRRKASLASLVAGAMLLTAACMSVADLLRELGCVNPELAAAFLSSTGGELSGEDLLWIYIYLLLTGGYVPPPYNPTIRPTVRQTTGGEGYFVVRTDSAGHELAKTEYDAALKGSAAVVEPLASARLRVAGAAHPEPRIFLVNESGNTVLAIDPAQPQTFSSVRVGTAPKGIAITPDGKLLFVVNQGARNVSILDVKTFTLIETVPLGVDKPGAVAITPDGTRAYVLDQSDTAGGVVPIDVATRQVFPLIRTGRGPIDLDFSPDGSLLFVSNNGGNGVSIIDVLTGTVTGLLVADKPWGVRVSRDGNLLYVASSVTAGKIIAFDLQTNERAFEVAVGDTPAGIALSPDGRTLGVANQKSTFVSIVDLLQRKEASRIDAPEGLGTVVGVQPAPPRT